MGGPGGRRVGEGVGPRRGTWGTGGGWGGAASPLPQLLSELVFAIGRNDIAVTRGFRKFLFGQVWCIILHCFFDSDWGTFESRLIWSIASTSLWVVLHCLLEGVR